MRFQKRSIVCKLIARTAINCNANRDICLSGTGYFLFQLDKALSFGTGSDLKNIEYIRIACFLLF